MHLLDCLEVSSDSNNDKFQRCLICQKLSSAIHMHHTIPQALGGESSLQIPLDGDCHTTLHAKASACVSFNKGNRKKRPGSFWANPEHELNAEPWVNILVRAMMNPPRGSDEKLTLLPSIKVDAERRVALDCLKQDLQGISNMSQVLKFCIDFTLMSKGLLQNVEQTKNKTNNEKVKPQRNDRGTATLW